MVFTPEMNTTPILAYPQSPIVSYGDMRGRRTGTSGPVSVASRLSSSEQGPATAKKKRTRDSAVGQGGGETPFLGKLLAQASRNLDSLSPCQGETHQAAVNAAIDTGDQYFNGGE